MKTELYEWLARWRDGKLSGYHVQLITTYDDGKVSISDAMTPASAEAQGYSLTDILDKLHTDALKLVDEHVATIAEKDAEISAKAQEHAEALAVKTAEVSAKSAEAAAEKAVRIAMTEFATKVGEIAATEKDDPDRETKEQEAAQLAAQVAAKDAELTLLKMPAEEKRKAEIQAQIDKLTAELAKA